MASQGSVKSSSRWGSFLQQAVAGVESRLDTILADDESKPCASSISVSKQSPEIVRGKEADIIPQRIPSHSRRNDRLQERLAKAVVNRRPTAAQSVDTTTESPRLVSLDVISVKDDEPTHFVSENKPTVTGQLTEPVLETLADKNSTSVSSDVAGILSAVEKGHDSGSASRRSIQGNTDLHQVVERNYSLSEVGDIDTTYNANGSPHLELGMLSSISIPIDGSRTQTPENNLASAQSREETKAYMEHIDALQAKLRYLTNQASEVSKKDAGDTADQVEAKLPAKDLTWQEELRRLEELLKVEKVKNTELRDDISSTEIERELGNERQRARLRDLQEKLDYEKEATKRIENGLQTEIGVLDSRLESYRTRAEEAFSTVNKDNQVKLLRQTEVLQSQYSVATQNWRGIESSLLARIANLEKERDEVMREENETRRKSREANVKLRRMEEEFQQATMSIAELQETVYKTKTELAMREKIISKTHRELETTQSSLKDVNARAGRLADQLHDLKITHHEAFLMSPETSQPRSIAESSFNHLGAKPSTENFRPSGRPQLSKSALGFGNGPTSTFDRPLSRRESTQPSQVSGLVFPVRQDSNVNLTHQTSNGHTPETPSIRTEHFDDYFDGMTTPLTPDRTVNDVMSVSATAAGPSVQLIERMSAAVRRLETEKASSLDDLGRVTAQRDDMRRQVMSLMQENEEKKAANDKVKVLEQEVSIMNQRYQTTLEMLGERSELVEELRADVADVKQMYKDLVESTLH